MLMSARADPRILVDSSEPLTLDNVLEYENAVSGDCIVEVPAVSFRSMCFIQKA